MANYRHLRKKRIHNFLGYTVTGIAILGVLIFLFIYNPHKVYTKPLVEKQKHKIYPTFTPRPHEKLKLPIVMYHYVEYVQDKGDTIRQSLNINPASFEWQLQALQKNGYTTFFVRDIPYILNSGQELPDRSIVLTFDDGYEDFYTDAYPLLKKYGFKATVYMIVDRIDTKGFLKRDQIQEMLESGNVELGSHTLNHVGLMSAKYDLARTEIFESKRKLEDMFDIPIKSFAYPGGFYDDQAIKLVEEAGYTIALTTQPGIVLDRHNMYEIPRIRAGYLSTVQIDSFFEHLSFK